MDFIPTNVEPSSAKTQLFFMPSIFEAVVYPLVSFILVGALHLKRLIESHTSFQPIDFSPYHRVVGNVTSFLDKHILPDIILALVWAVIGLVAYLIIWYVSTLIGGAYEDEHVRRTFIFPNEKQRVAFRIAEIGRVLIRVFGSFLVVAWFVFLITRVLPKITALVSYDSRSNWFLIAVIIVGSVMYLAVYAFIFTILCRLVALRARVFAE